MHSIDTANNQSIASAKGKGELELDEGRIENQDVLQGPDLATNFHIDEQNLQERPDEKVQCRKL